MLSRGVEARNVSNPETELEMVRRHVLDAKGHVARQEAILANMEARPPSRGRIGQASIADDARKSGARNGSSGPAGAARLDHQISNWRTTRLPNCSSAPYFAWDRSSGRSAGMSSKRRSRATRSRNSHPVWRSRDADQVRESGLGREPALLQAGWSKRRCAATARCPSTSLTNTLRRHASR